VLRLAREADEQAKSEPEPKKGKRKAQRVSNSEPAQPVDVEVIEPPDPEFVEMCKWGVGSVVDIANQKFDWSDPGIHWKEKVSTAVARIITRLQPMEPSLTTDLIIISGYVALWAIPNVSAQVTAKRVLAKRTSANNPDIRDNGQRQNVQDARDATAG
jgi:hypothetical protein